MLERRFVGTEKPLLKALSETFPDVAYSTLCAMLRKNDVKINSVRKRDGIVYNGDIITIYPPLQKIKEIFEDDNILIAYKPKGIESEGEVSFESQVKKIKGNNYILMHRLDRNTDGLLIFAKNAIAEREIYAAMKNGKIVKTYTAEVYGAPTNPCGIFKAYYQKSELNKKAYISSSPKEGYIPVEIEYSTIGKTVRGTLLEIRLHGGKMHQIRAMLAFNGCFILGDSKYGRDTINKKYKIKKQQLTAVSLNFEFQSNSSLAYLSGKIFSI